MTDLNPQREQMAHESMVRTLAAQFEAIWPQERPLVERHGLSGAVRVLDAGCGTGEACGALATMWPEGTVLGIDVLEGPLAIARERHAELGERVRFEMRSVFDTGLPDASFDLTACRHVLQSVPFPERALAELVRVTRPGGVVHTIAEDYDLLHFPPGGTRDPRDFWHLLVPALSTRGGFDLRLGRHAVPMLRAAGLEDVRLDLVVVDTERVPRATFDRILEAWCDGYAEWSAEAIGWTVDDVRAAYDAMRTAVRGPDTYAAWFVPVVSGRVPQR